MHFTNAAAAICRNRGARALELQSPGWVLKSRSLIAPSPQPAEMLANTKTTETNNRLQEVLAIALGEDSKDRADGLLNTKEQLRMKHYPAPSKERPRGTCDEKTVAVFSTGNSAQNTGRAQAIITQNLIFMPA